MNQNKIFLINQEYSSSYPLNDTPVSYNKDGKAVSLFQDDIWDFSSYVYTPTSRSTINFNCFDDCENLELREKIIFEFKIIIYGFIYCNINNSKNISIQTIISGYASNLRKILNIAIECNSTLSNISNNHLLIKKLFNTLSFMDRKKFSQTSHLFKKLSALSIVFKEHNFSLNQKQFTDLEKLKPKLKNNPVKQHLVIPSMIYYNLNEFLDKKLNDFKNISSDLFELFIKNKIKSPTDLKEPIKSYFLENKVYKSTNLFTYFKKIINLAFTKIIMFSGIRHSEALLLPYNTFQEISLNGKTISIINGYTSKLTQSGPLKATWITSSQIKIAIEILQSFTQLYLKVKKIDLNSLDYEKLPLCSFKFSTSKGKKITTGLYDHPIHIQIHLPTTLEFFDFNPIVDHEAIKELNLTSPFIDISDYGVSLNSTFPLTPHQFRRTLTVYAARSGLVNMPALKAQLKHLKQDMTDYYANYAPDAVNIFENDLVNELKTETNLNDFLQFEVDIINAINPLYGAEGTRLQTAKNQKILPIFLTDKKRALQDIKDGKMSYKITPLGGCARVGSCDEIAQLTITSCISCKDAIFSDKSEVALKIALENFEKQLRQLPKDSPFTVHLTAEIKQISTILHKRQIMLENTNA